MMLRTTRTDGRGSEGNVKEEGNNKSQCSKFLSNLFLVKTKDGGQMSVINLKYLEEFIPCNHFKMEGLQNLRYLLQEGDYLCKLDLKDTSLTEPKTLICFDWLVNINN